MGTARSSGTEARVIVVTGVSRGIGRALLDLFARSGHRVAGCARSIAKLAEARTANASADDRLLLRACDVVDDTAVRAFASEVIARFGAPNLLINNAALINRNAALWELSADEVSPVFRTNVEGAVNVIRHFVPAMISAGRGVIVNLSSGWGRSVSPEVAPYCATKFAIEGLSKALAEELPPPLAAIPLNPGTIDTDMLRSCFGGDAAGHQSAEQWAKRAAPFLLALGRKDNGRSLSVP